MAATPEELRVRELIWDRIKATIDASKDDPVTLDALVIAERLVGEFPGSGLTARQVAMEFHRIRRAMRPARR